MPVKTIVLLLTLLLPYAAHARNFSSEKGVEISNRVSQASEQALIKSINSGDVTKVKELLKAGTNPNTKDETGQPAIINAVKTGRLEIIETLLEHGADANAIDRKGRLTALGAAAYMGRLAVVKLLLSKGARVNAKSECNHTALIWAINGATQKGLVDYMRQRLPPAVFESEEGDDIEILAPAGDEHIEIVGTLIAAGADVNAEADCETGDWTATALTDASLGGNVEIVQLLLAHGADPNKGKAATPLAAMTYIAKEMEEEKVDEGDSAEEQQLQQLRYAHWQSLSAARAKIIQLLKEAGAKERRN